MRSPRYAPAGLLVEHAGHRIAIDGGEPGVQRFRAGPLTITPRRVVHTSHPAFAYELAVPQGRVVWAPEFLRFPRWTARAELMFAEAAGFSRPILFAGRVGGHAGALSVCETAARLGVKRLVLCHIGRPTIRALDAGWRPGFGEVGRDGAVFLLTRGGSVRSFAGGG